MSSFKVLDFFGQFQNFSKEFSIKKMWDNCRCKT